MTLRHNTEVQNAMATANAAIAKLAREANPLNEVMAETALLNLKLVIESYLERKEK